jgi:EAL domain-containing protein (putative c-di-GMP-specific phosphodiesterase class I)
VLKIDRAFISGISTSPEAKALIHTLVQLGKTLGLETVAEGIEQASELRYLRAEECVSGQGYLLARPLDAAGAEAFLSRRLAA